MEGLVTSFQFMQLFGWGLFSLFSFFYLGEDSPKSIAIEYIVVLALQGDIWPPANPARVPA